MYQLFWYATMGPQVPTLSEIPAMQLRPQPFGVEHPLRVVVCKPAGDDSLRRHGAMEDHTMVTRTLP